MKRILVVCAVILLAVLAIQSPAEQAHRDADRAQAASTLTHTANQLAAATDGASALSKASAAQIPTDPHASEAPASGAHHHHADGPSLHEQAAGANAPTVATTTAARFRLDNDHRAGLTGNPQDRPPRPDLELTA